MLGRCKPALFPISTWNQHNIAIIGGPRTTNCCEGFHNSLNSLFFTNHPSIWKFLDGIRRDIAINKLTLTDARTGNEEPIKNN